MKLELTKEGKPQCPVCSHFELFRTRVSNKKEWCCMHCNSEFLEVEDKPKSQPKKQTKKKDDKES